MARSSTVWSESSAPTGDDSLLTNVSSFSSTVSLFTVTDTVLDASPGAKFSVVRETLETVQLTVSNDPQEMPTTWNRGDWKTDLTRFPPSWISTFCTGVPAVPYGTSPNSKKAGSTVADAGTTCDPSTPRTIETAAGKDRRC
jgi:hypothetical protein